MLSSKQGRGSMNGLSPPALLCLSMILSDGGIPAVDCNWEVESGNNSADAEWIPNFFELMVSSLRWNLGTMGLSRHRCSELANMDVLENFTLLK